MSVPFIEEGNVSQLSGLALALFRYAKGRWKFSDFPYQETPHSLAAWEPGIAQIAQDSSLHEVILNLGQVSFCQL